MSGKLYAVGVGSGDPDLMTLKAIKTIKNADCIACPESHGEPGMAYEIAKEAVPEITSKELLLLEFPMRKDDLFDAHRKAAEQIIYYLSSGKNIAFLTVSFPASVFQNISRCIGNVSGPGFFYLLISSIAVCRTDRIDPDSYSSIYIITCISDHDKLRNISLS